MSCPPSTYAVYGKPLRPDRADSLYAATDRLGANQLSGFAQDASDWISAQAARVRDQLQTLLGKFLIARQQLTNLARLADRLEAHPQLPERDRVQLQVIGGRLAQLRENQGTIELELQAAGKKLAEATGQDVVPAGLGAFPLIAWAIIAGASALIAQVTGKVVIHTQEVASLDRQLAAIGSGLLDPAEMARLRESNVPTSSVGVGLLAGAVPLVLGLGIMAFVFFRK